MEYSFNPRQLGAQFKKTRRALKISLLDLAGRTGYTRQTLSELESGGNVGVHVMMAALSAMGKGIQIIDVRVDYDQLKGIFEDE